ncbi:MAG: hypothetical protein IJJ28_06325, partial [Lentisphaeria bacterium]|nr:hypothetical protein [Lentisphaeria bacterium]
VAEFRRFAEKLKPLRVDMTPEETARILGKPDRYQTVGAKGPNTREHANAIYDFLRVADTSQKNLTVTLWFEKDSTGVFRLKTVYEGGAMTKLRPWFIAFAAVMAFGVFVATYPVWARLHDNTVVAGRDISRIGRFFHDCGLTLPPTADPVSALVRRGGRAFEVAAFKVGEADFRAFMKEADGKYRLTVRGEAERENLLPRMAAAFAAAKVPFPSEADRARAQAAETRITDSSVYFVSVPDADRTEVFMIIVYNGALPE